MRLGNQGNAIRSLACAALVAFSGCGGAAENLDGRPVPDLATRIDPSNFSGDVTFGIAEMFPAGDRRIPFAFFLGLAPETETRLGANAFVDLRDLQLVLPDLLSGAIEPSCGLGLDLRFGGAAAEGDVIRAWATADARLYRCRNRGTEQEQRGARLLTQSIDIDATLSAGLAGECIGFRLVDLDLDPRGLLGGLATLLGVTERSRAAILEKAGTTLSENLVCPDLPPALDLLDPHFAAAGIREIGDGGVGAALSGSVDLSAAALVEFLGFVEARARGPDATEVATLEEGKAAFRLDETITVRGTDIGLGLDIRLAAVAPTRIGIEAVLDLRDLQARLPELFADEILVDECGGRIRLRGLEVEARQASIIGTGRLAVESFECERTGPGSWQRGALLNAEEVGVRAEMSADLVDRCIFFRLIDLTRNPPGAFAQLDTGSGRPEAARALLLEAIGLLLEDSPLCPELPPELAVLDPQFDRGAPQEIENGGFGIALDGSIDVSPTNLVDALRLLQQRGALPPAP